MEPSSVTYKTGLPFFIITTFYDALNKVLSRGDNASPHAGILDWLDLLFEALAELPIQTVAQILPPIDSDKLDRIWKESLPNDAQSVASRRAAFDELKNATKAFMNRKPVGYYRGASVGRVGTRLAKKNRWATAYPANAVVL